LPYQVRGRLLKSQGKAMHLPTRLVCPHCHAVLKSNKAPRLGKQVNCLRCRFSFTITPAELSAMGTPDHASSILATATLAESDEPEVMELESEPALNANRHEAPLMSMPYAPPPCSNAPAPHAPAARDRVLAGVMTGFALLAFVGVALLWYCYTANGDGEDKVAALPAMPELVDETHGQPAMPAESTPPAVVDVHKPETKLPKAHESGKPETVALLPKVPAASPKAVKPAPKPKSASAEPAANVEQRKINEAIDRGVQFLRNSRLPNGNWPSSGMWVLGHSALPGLTLLECQVPANDPVIQQTAQYVRAAAKYSNQTYEISLAILFLDRLGDPKDRKLIEQLALRLIAGQMMGNFGWNYSCPALDERQMKEMLTLLENSRPAAARLLTALEKDKKARDANPLPKDQPAAFQNPLPGVQGPMANPNSDKPAKKKDVEEQDAGPPAKKKNVSSTERKSNRNVRKWYPIMFGRDDNSNSQFALLALWAARRHGVPTEPALALAERRYRQSQNPDGGWGYQIHNQTTEAMTGVGLLGLAMGHGASEKGLQAVLDARKNQKAPPRPSLDDKAIHKGLEAFGRFIRDPDPNDPHPSMVNLYFLWTVERVAMLYGLKAIEGKNWYGWGASVLVPNQLPNGSWTKGGYHLSSPTIDTCFALLFLKRSNLVSDLTENLNFYLVIPGREPTVSKK
jgi:hypothetical protein